MSPSTSWTSSCKGSSRGDRGSAGGGSTAPGDTVRNVGDWDWDPAAAYAGDARGRPGDTERGVCGDGGGRGDSRSECPAAAAAAMAAAAAASARARSRSKSESRRSPSASTPSMALTSEATGVIGRAAIANGWIDREADVTTTFDAHVGRVRREAERRVGFGQRLRHSRRYLLDARRHPGEHLVPSAAPVHRSPAAGAPPTGPGTDPPQTHHPGLTVAVSRADTARDAADRWGPGLRTRGPV